MALYGCGTIPGQPQAVYSIANGPWGGRGPRSGPIGGGTNYSDIFSENVAHRVIITPTVAAAQAELNAASSGQIVYIRDGLVIPASVSLIVPNSVTLAGGRGRAASPARLRYTPTGGSCVVLGVGARSTGLIIEGNGPAADNYHQGIAGNTDAEMDNCEVFNFGKGNGIAVGTGAYVTSRVWIHHCYIHHLDTLAGNGYGIHLGPSGLGNELPWLSLVEGSIIDTCKHLTSANGRASFTLRYNYLGDAITHVIDMHGNNDIIYNPPYTSAGDSMFIHHNTFLDGGTWNVILRGTPHTECRVYRNWLYGIPASSPTDWDSWKGSSGELGLCTALASSTYQIDGHSRPFSSNIAVSAPFINMSKTEFGALNGVTVEASPENGQDENWYGLTIPPSDTLKSMRVKVETYRL